MRIAITGSSGLIGSALVPVLEDAGHEVTRLLRPTSKPRPDARTPRRPDAQPLGRSDAPTLLWDPANNEIDKAGFEGHDAVIHLAGDSLLGVWTKAKKQRIRASRVQGTALLARTLAGLRQPPGVLVTASAIGFYGDRPASEQVDESSPRGPGFLADVVEAWEGAAEPARAAGIRVVNTRFALVLSRRGGALAVTLPIFRLGLGGRLGSGRQIWSWVAIDDVVHSIIHVLRTPSLVGPVNVSAPRAVTNLSFTRTLGRVLRRPTIFAVPEQVLHMLGGTMAREMLLAGVRALPRKLEQSGYAFIYPELEQALRAILASDSAQ